MLHDFLSTIKASDATRLAFVDDGIQHCAPGKRATASLAPLGLQAATLNGRHL